MHLPSLLPSPSPPIFFHFSLLISYLFAMEQNEGYKRVEDKIKSLEHQLSVCDEATHLCEQSGTKRRERRREREREREDRENTYPYKLPYPSFSLHQYHHTFIQLMSTIRERGREGYRGTLCKVYQCPC